MPEENCKVLPRDLYFSFDFASPRALVKDAPPDTPPSNKQELMSRLFEPALVCTLTTFLLSILPAQSGPQRQPVSFALSPTGPQVVQVDSPRIVGDWPYFVAVWEVGTAGSLFVNLSNSVDGGVQWSALSTATSIAGDTPRLASDGPNVLFVYRTPANAAFAQMSTDSGRNWTSATQLNDPIHPVTTGFIECTVASGKAFVAFRSGSDLFVDEATFGSSLPAWALDQQITASVSGQLSGVNFEIAAANGNTAKVGVAFRQQNVGLQFVERNIAGGGWTFPVGAPLSTSAGGSVALCALETGGQVNFHIAY